MQALAKKKKKQIFFQQPARVTGRMKIFFNYHTGKCSTST